MAEKHRKSNFLLLTSYFLLPRSGTSGACTQTAFQPIN